MEETIATLLNHVLELLLIPLLVWAFGHLKSWLEANRSNAWLKLLDTAVFSAVDAAEQTFGAGQGPQKKANAIERVQRSLSAKAVQEVERATGRPVAEAVDTRVEAAVAASKAVRGVAVAAPLPAPSPSSSRATAS